MNGPVVCFSGPSLSPSAARALFPEARCLPPAAQGDVYAACKRHEPRAICLVDGYFEHRPAVTHKELLWALQHRIAVYGAASMGALRAVELAPFGMRGWGRVYEMYASGVVEDDDEVAVLHASEELDYRTQSEALVNIRCTLDRAYRQGVISLDAMMAVIERARSWFYPERTYARLTAELPEILPGKDAERLRGWLSRSDQHVEVKRQDAESLLLHVRAGWTMDRLPRPEVEFELPQTDAWLSIVRAVNGAGHSNDLLDLVTEVQLQGAELFEEVVRIATWRTLCLQLHHANGAVRDVVRDEEAAIRAEGARARHAVIEQFPGALRELGAYGELERRAQRKRALMKGAPAPHGEERTSLVRQYFERRLRRQLPADLTEYAISVGFDSAETFVNAVCRDAALEHESRLRRD